MVGLESNPGIHLLSRVDSISKFIYWFGWFVVSVGHVLLRRDYYDDNDVFFFCGIMFVYLYSCSYRVGELYRQDVTAVHTFVYSQVLGQLV